MTCWCCGQWLHLDNEGSPPGHCPGCGEAIKVGNCGDDECAMHDDHCLLEEPRYRPETCRLCGEEQA